jgi:hypothetical protein
MNPTVSAPSETRQRGVQHDVSQSVAELASLDLDAALQLLADRAQYVTGAAGAAIALLRAQSNDMLCRASVGSIAPQLGALLSTEHGLSGESIRTRQLQRCEDARNDARVDSQACSRLGIASVLVMPILSEGKATGVFELFSGRSYAFDEGDIAALQRLSAMVELAIKFSLAAQPLPQQDQVPTENHPSTHIHIHPTRAAKRVVPDPIVAPREIRPPASPNLITKAEAQKPSQPAAEKAATQTKKPLFWSAAANSRPSAPSDALPSAVIPPTLRNLRKCQACGFPISPGRQLCVECEEKQWRGRK